MAVAELKLKTTTQQQEAKAVPAFKTNILDLKRNIGNARLLFQGTSSCKGISIHLTGESGSGKTFLAQDFHDSSEQGGRLVVINCPNIPPDLFEAELFGSKKGAYTNSIRDRPGLLSQADGGTIFLDEVSELPLQHQAKLLRVIESGKFHRVGDDEEHSLNVRWISASNKDIRKMVEEGTFRSDLYYRLCQHSLAIPPLRLRQVDFDQLVDSILTKMESSISHLRSNALEKLRSHSWPGNIRELNTVLQKAIILSQREEIQDFHLLLDVQLISETPGILIDEDDPGIRVGMTLKQAKELLISATLEKCPTKAEAAKLLGVSRASLSR